MNFNKIKKQNPRAWEMFEDCYGKIRIAKHGYLYWTNPDKEELQFPYSTFYDFFDDERIVMILTPNTSLSSWWASMRWENGDIMRYVNLSVNCESRDEAFEKCLEFAFVILENRLKV